MIGQGYVGLPIAMAAGMAGHQVLGLDLDESKVNNLNLGFSHIEDIPNGAVQGLIAEGKYSDVVVIAVPTPLNSNREPDVIYLRSSAKVIGENLGSKTLIINESTSYPGTLRNLIKPTVEKYSKSPISHLYAISPERVDPGNLKWNLLNTPRLLSGLTPEATEKAAEFYSSFCKRIILTKDPETAEMAKLFENTFRQVNIALVNELAEISHGLGISANEVISAASSKPYGFMGFRPGLGVGGHCIPVDPSYLAFAANEIGIEAKFINLANQVNLEMPRKILARIIAEHGNSISGKSVLICGLAYKSNIGDVRESPSFILRDELISKGAFVSWYDPMVKEIEGEKSVELSGKNFDLAIVAVLHATMSIDEILASSKYVFDCTGNIKSAIQL